MKKILLSFVAMLALTLGVSAQFVDQATGFATASRGIRNICAINGQTL